MKADNITEIYKKGIIEIQNFNKNDIIKGEE